jgi:hypothetical protein
LFSSPFQERTDSDEYLKIIEDHWKYLPEWLRLWGADYLEDSRMRLKVLPHTTAPATAHHYKASTQALRELLIDVTDTYTVRKPHACFKTGCLFENRMFILKPDVYFKTGCLLLFYN